MELRIFTEPQQGATYDDLLAVALKAEELGFGAFFRSDHYLAMGGDGGPGPSDAWTTLAGLARDTSTIRLGTMVTSATFRLPGPLAIQVAGVDAMSGGRVELGIGAGWFEAEHTAYGIPFPPTGERFDRLEEQLAVITGLWSADAAFSHTGSHYTLTDSPALPKPVQRDGYAGGPPVIIGGHGKKRTPALAAAYADEFNVPFTDVESGRTQFGRVREAAQGRELVYSAATILCVGRDEAEFRRRAEAIDRDPDELRATYAGGTVDEVVRRVGEWADAGASRLYLQVLDLQDLEHLELVAAEVARQV
ncbi:LLM class F420-dependent oxidoreductase [Nocardioides anomalus]|uniref:LLM class F420-dependent oxidoreductase n=1 Tax=Nocardioides anomalus TaxID=2712223 RepID=A0A6G6WER4_9ACTN|nr:LLM class F420-dependent oxidoreductase [Nocardioides anomalus]QIG43595.1 LLM class F420-dependent oxidoreductase [Nocardioides anomalus]